MKLSAQLARGTYRRIDAGRDVTTSIANEAARASDVMVAID
jgi:hypothetical protein